LPRQPKDKYTIAKKELSDLFFRHSDWSDKQFATELERIGAINKFEVPAEKTYRSIGRWLSNIRKQQQSAIYKALEEVYDPVNSPSNSVLREEGITFNKEERFWLREMSAKLDIWFFRSLGITGNKITVRDAYWSCRLLNVAPELFESFKFIDIYLWSVAYSTKQRLAEFSGEELNTTTEDLYFTHRAYLGGMSYQQYETIRKERKLELPFYDPKNDGASLIEVRTPSEKALEKEFKEKKLSGRSSLYRSGKNSFIEYRYADQGIFLIDGKLKDEYSREWTQENHPKLNSLVDVIFNVDDGLKPWQKIPFIFGALISEYPWVMPSVNFQYFICRELSALLYDGQYKSFKRIWGMIDKNKYDSTLKELDNRWKEQEKFIEDNEPPSADTVALIGLSITNLMNVVDKPFDYLIAFSSLLKPYIKEQEFNVGEVTTLDARSSTDDDNVFGWSMIYKDIYNK